MVRQPSETPRWQRILIRIAAAGLLGLGLYSLWTAQWWRAVSGIVCGGVLMVFAGQRAKRYENELALLLLGVSFLTQGLERGALGYTVMGGMCILGGGLSAHGTYLRSKIRP